MFGRVAELTRSERNKSQYETAARRSETKRKREVRTLNSTSITTARKAGAGQAIVLLLPAILVTMGAAALVPVIPQIHREFAHLPNVNLLTQLVLVIPSLFLVIFCPVMGWLGDRFGRRRLLLAGLALYAVVGVAPMGLQSISAILICRALVGVAEAAVLTLSTTMISDMFDGPERDRWLGFQAAIASASSVVIIAASGALAQFGWRAVFAIYLAALVMLVLVLATTWEPDRAARRAAGDVVVGQNKAIWKRLAAICAITLLASVTFFAVQLQAATAFERLGLVTPALMGMLIGFIAIGTPIGAVIFRFVNTRPTLVLLGVGFGAASIGLFGMGFAPTVVILTAALFIGQIGCGILLPTLLTAAVRGLGPEIRGRGIGIWQGTFSIGQFTSGVSFAMLVGHFGASPPAFAVLAWGAITAAGLAVAGYVFLNTRRAGPASR